MRWASPSSGLSVRSGSLCPTTRPRLRSTISVDWQQGHVTSISDLSRAIGSSPSAFPFFHDVGQAVKTAANGVHREVDGLPVRELRRQTDVLHLLMGVPEVIA